MMYEKDRFMHILSASHRCFLTLQSCEENFIAVARNHGRVIGRCETLLQQQWGGVPIWGFCIFVLLVSLIINTMRIS